MTCKQGRLQIRAEINLFTTIHVSNKRLLTRNYKYPVAIKISRFRSNFSDTIDHDSRRISLR